MVAIHKKKHSLTLEEFLEFPETKPYCEYINGGIEEKSMPKGEHSIIQTNLVAYINQLGKQNKTFLALTELRCTFGGSSIVPDIAVFEWSRLPKTQNGRIANNFTIYPDWIIEILSPEQSTNKVMKKILFCIKQGTKLGWLIDSEDESVMIFKPDQLPEIKSENEILPVLKYIQDWGLSVSEIFNWLNIE
ncbi:MAG: Uma2 family endonuclease [Leptospiraceae bacterium]|nr:Uma2 family endonuclease [Leptospiraceae bacterium]MCP5495074.1 Uma2 family endonuclease [Leptospiraceae bacterium]